MAPPLTGQVRALSHGYSARIRLAPGVGGRISFELAARTEAEADARAALLAGVAGRLRSVASADEIKILLEEAGKARTEKALAQVTAAADAIAKGETTKAASAKAPTFEAFAKTWTTGELHKKHPDHVRAKDATRDLEVLRLHINPVIGTMRITDVAIEDAERVMSRLPAELSPRTRKLIAQCMHKVLSLGVYPGRHLASNPIPREWMPKIPRSANKAKAFLYPAEDAKLLGSRDVPIIRRLIYGVLAREGMQASELERLKWRDVDVEHGRIRLDENKTNDPRAWALSPDVTRTLAWWQKQRRGEANDLVIGIDLGDAAWWLRGDETETGKRPGDLRKAGITRAELFERSMFRQPIRLHDLRATFVTVSLASGRTEQWVHRPYGS